jgi:predicted ATP-grasp superfamily ATP-dependent carboligase
METKLEFKEYDPSKISKPTLIVGVPEAGLVGIIASSYLRDQMKLPELGYIESDLLPAVVVVHESKPKHPIRIFGKDNLGSNHLGSTPPPKTIPQPRKRSRQLGQIEKHQTNPRHHKRPLR